MSVAEFGQGLVRRLRLSARQAMPLVIALLAIPVAAVAGTGPEAVLRWQQLDDGAVANFFRPRASKLLPDGTLIVALGSSYSQSYHLSIARFAAGSPTGNVVPVHLPTGAERIAFDDCGNVLVASPQAYWENPGPYESNVWLMKFDSATGRPLWNDPFVWGDAGNQDGAIPTALSVDADGDALLTALTTEGHVTFRLDATDGTLEWTSAVVPDITSTRVSSAVDEQGDLYLASDSGNQIRVWAIHGGTGALLWGPLMVDPSGADEYLQDFFVDPDGDLILITYDGSAAVLQRFLAANGTADWGPISVPGAIAQSSTVGSGGVFIAGTRVVTPGNSAFFVSAFDLETGSSLWGPVDFPNPTNTEPALAADSNGDVLFSVLLYDQAFDYQLASGRIGRDGALVWGPEFRGPMLPHPPLALVEPDGTFVEMFVENLGDFELNRVARRNGATGQQTQISPHFFGLWNDAMRFSDAEVLPDGNLVTASTHVLPPDINTIVRKIDRVTGQDLWSQTFPSASGRLAVDPSGDLLSTSGFEMRKLDGDTGAVIWGPVTTAEPQTLPRIAAFDASGNVIVASVMNLFPRTAFLEKRSGATGALLWGPVGYGAIGSHNLIGLALDASGNAFVSLSRPPTSNNDWVTLKHSGATGSVLWGPIVYDREGRYDSPVSLQALPGGDVVVSGYSSSASDQTNLAVIRYAGANGSVVWGPILLQGPGGWPTGAGDMIVNTSGDIFLTGFSWDPMDPYDAELLAAKLVGASGALAWGPSLHDTGISDIGTDIALLPSGDPVALGYRDRWQLPGEIGPILFSWDAATGGLRWGPIQHEGFVDEFSHWLGVGGDTIYVAADAYLNGIRPKGWFFPTTLLLAYVESLGIATLPGDLLGTCDEAFSAQLEATNVNGTAIWTVDSGDLPDGLTLSSAGLLTGTPTEIGEFPITVQVQDSSLATAARELTIVVREEAMVPILATPVDDCTWMLSVPGGWTSYSWEPGGQTTATITVSPLHDTVYGVTVGDGSGCTVRGSILVRATRLIETDCDAPGLSAIDPTSGPASGGTELTLSGSGFQAGSQVRIGGIEVPTAFQNPGTIEATTPPLVPGTLSHVLVANPNLGSAVLFKAFLADFLDVPQAHIFHDFVEVLVRARVTAGCGGGGYCPDLLVTRAQMAVFLLVAKNGLDYIPPPATGNVFNDVPLGSFAAAFIEALAAAQVTGGCGGGNYCPDVAVTREQMSILLLRTLEGPSYAPPSCTTPTFSDVPCTSPYGRWIEELVDRGITAGCGGGLYCPLQGVSRGQMAVFLAVTFGLP